MSAGVISFVVALILVPVVRQVCICWSLYDPTGPLKIHSQPIPRLGGIAIALALFTGVQVHVARNHSSQLPWKTFFAALAIAWAAGLIDDFRLHGLSPILRLAAQFIAGMVLWHGGWRLSPIATHFFSLSAVCFPCVLFTNAFNFLDGSDGLCAGVAGVIAAAYIALPGTMLSSFGFIVACSLLGVSIAFLLFNFPPAKIFMGDSGSTILGFVVAFLCLDFYRTNASMHMIAASPSILIFPFLVAALPLLDTMLAVLRRLSGQTWPAHGDRRHFYDLLLALGWSSKNVALVCYALTAAMCFIAWLGLQLEFKIAVSLYVLSVSVLVFAAVRLGSLRAKEFETQMERVPTSYSL